MENLALVSLYHPTGAKVSVPLAVGIEMTLENASLIMRSIDNLIDAGFTVNLPGLEDGEMFEQIAFVVHREKANDDGTVTPIVDLYSQAGTFRQLGMYLNSPDDVAAFEQACGVSLLKLPLYEGSAPIERGKNSNLDKKYLTLLAAAPKVIYKLNPKWEGENDKKHSKRMFVRWESTRVAAVQADPATGEIKSDGNVELIPAEQEPLHQKLAAEFVSALAKQTGFKPGSIAKVLAKMDGKTTTMSAAMKFIESNIADVKG